MGAGSVNAGCEAVQDDATSGELPAKAQALQSALYDLDGKTKRAIALDKLVMWDTSLPLWAMRAKWPRSVCSNCTREKASRRLQLPRLVHCIAAAWRIAQRRSIIQRWH